MFARNKWLMLFVLITILLISACGNSENEVGDDQTVYPDEETSSSEREAEMDETNNEEQTNLSDAVEDEEVWYQVLIKDSDEGVIGKDARINVVYVFKNNEVSELRSILRSIDDEDFTLGSINDLSDDEVVDNLLNDIPEIDKHNDEIDKEGLRDIFKIDIRLNEPYTWMIESDATGNAAERMYFNLDKDIDESGDYYYDSKVSLSFEEPLGYAINVFDRYYDGFTSYEDNIYMITRIDSEDDALSIKFDDPDTDKEDIIIE